MRIVELISYMYVLGSELWEKNFGLVKRYTVNM